MVIARLGKKLFIFINYEGLMVIYIGKLYFSFLKMIEIIRGTLISFWDKRLYTRWLVFILFYKFWYRVLNRIQQRQTTKCLNTLFNINVFFIFFLLGMPTVACLATNCHEFQQPRWCQLTHKKMSKYIYPPINVFTLYFRKFNFFFN